MKTLEELNTICAKRFDRYYSQYLSRNPNRGFTLVKLPIEPYKKIPGAQSAIPFTFEGQWIDRLYSYSNSLLYTTVNSTHYTIPYYCVRLEPKPNLSNPLPF